jgi:pectin methylesterase-like acyl-CoA thioesterase
MTLKLFAAACGAALSLAANAACPGGASWCRDFEHGSGSWTGHAPAVQAQAETANHVLLARAGEAIALVPAADTPAAGGYFVEGRLRPAARGGKGYLIAAYADEGNWLGFGLDITPGSDRLAVIIARMEGGKLRQLKRVGRAADAPGSFTTLRLDRNGNALTLHVNGQRTIGVDEPSLPPARVGVLSEGGDFEIDDLRLGDMRIAPASIGLAQRGLQLGLQAGDKPGRYPVRAASRDGIAAVSFTARSSDPAVARAAVDGDSLVITPLRAGAAAITITSAQDNNVALTVNARVGAAFAASNQAYALDGRVTPAANARGVPVDSVLRLRFDSPPALGASGTVRIVRAADKVVVDEVHAGYEVNAIGAAQDGFRRVVRYQPFQIKGNEIAIHLHDDRLAYGTDYYVLVDGKLFDGARLGGKPFTGIGMAAGWRFSTRPGKPSGRTLTVDDDGPADFRTVQGALNHAMRHVPRAEPVTIKLANGRYEELLYLRGKDQVTLQGESRDGVLIASENNDGINPGAGAGQAALAPGASGGRAVFLVEDADLLRMETLSLVNTTWNSKSIGGQAETINFASEGRLAATDATFISEQDTIRVNGYSWFYRCLVAGTVDFIWGPNHAALFEESEIRSLGHSGGSERGGYVVQARTVAREDPGFVFLNSRLTHGPGPAGNDVLPGSIYLARPGVATAWDKVSYINSRIDNHIAPAGWNGEPRAGEGWGEWNSMDPDGKPLDLSRRTGGRALTAEQAARLSARASVFAGFDSGKGWNPSGKAALERWGSMEVALAGPSAGNPFMEVELSATFRQGQRAVKVPGFYDGDGSYKIRFMPDSAGVWTYETSSNRAELNRKTGQFDVAPAGPNNHGPVRVRNTWHFAYEDGTPFWQVGTTSYSWTHQTEALEQQTLRTLAAAPFNKMRMAVFPNHDVRQEPPRYPFAGTPPRGWDFTRFNPAFFRHLEQRVAQLRDLGIEADIILFHPYDKGYWGFDRMPDDVNQRYLRYVVARLAAYRNVWWSMANEFDFLKEKTMPEWDSYFKTVQASDPWQHLRSIHNALAFYNHTQPWVTHVSVQSGAIAEDYERAVLLRDVYNKPVVYDEVKYEGNLSRRWGQLTPEAMVLRFWQGAIAGTYVGHSETYEDPNGLMWLGKGGVLRGQSPARLAFFRKILGESPPEGLEPIDKWQGHPFAGKHGEYYLGYFGLQQPVNWPFVLHKTGLKDGMKFRAEVIDTWNMTVTRVDGVFEIKQQGAYNFADKDGRSIALPGRPYMAVRVVRIP